MEIVYHMIYLDLLKKMEATMAAGKPIPDSFLKLAVHCANLAGVPPEEIAFMEAAATHPDRRLH